LILYLDTSSLVKLFVEEAGSRQTLAAVERAEIVATSIVAYAEARAALARRRRENSLTAVDLRRVRATLDEEWPRFLSVDVDESLVRSAGDLAERQRLRGFDALHLASYVRLVKEFAGEQVRFLSADRALSRAASRVLRSRR
jgi:predicted nucleic acid-binding protein